MTDEFEFSRQCYEERRMELSKIRSDSVTSLDKAVLQLSTGALVVTITFIDEIGKPYSCCTNVLLISFWVCYLAVILISLLGFYFARKNADFKIRSLDKFYSEDPVKWHQKPEEISCYKTPIDLCNFFCLFLFIVGSILFFVYAFLVQTHANLGGPAG